jgi:hypothetical protein
VCVDYWNLNRATPKDEYMMPIAQVLVNRASGNKIISFLDGNAGYNQIFMAKGDVAKTTFCCPGFIGLFEWVMMMFVLKNARATNERAMNLIFHDLLGTILEVYINDMVIKSAGFMEHLADLMVTFERMRSYNLKMNPLKCTFGVSAERFMGFIVHDQGIEIDLKKVESIKKLGKRTCKHDAQKLLGKINYLCRFITNLAGKVDLFMPLVRLKHENEFMWGEEQNKVFERIKEYLATPPVLRAPRVGESFRLYIAAEGHVIGAALTQHDEGKESAITYLSRRLVDGETRYTPIEKLCLSLFYASTKLRHYLLTSSCTVVCRHDIIKCVLKDLF